MPVEGSGAVVHTSGISQPLNCEIPSAGGDADHLYPPHHHHPLEQAHYSYHHTYSHHYQSSLLAVVGSTGTPPSQEESQQVITDRMTTDLQEWDVENPSKGDISMMDNSHGMISPPPTTVTGAQITASAASSSSSGAAESPPQDLWWTEGLAMQAQQEYPGELGELMTGLSC